VTETAPDRKEQRKDRRYPADIRLRSVRTGELMEMVAINLSLGGAHCRSERYVQPMTRFNVMLDLPGKPGSAAGRPPLTVEAVVVRVERASKRAEGAEGPVDPERLEGPSGPEKAEGPFRLSLWFQRMGSDDRARLRSFLGQDGN
jgi:hypothetical protein